MSRLAGAVLLGALLLSSHVRADDPIDDAGTTIPADASRAAHAQQLLDEGVRLFTEEANHEAARARFTESFELVPTWQALNGTALTYQEQGRYVRAITAYRRLLDEFAPVLTPIQRTTVERRLAALLPRVAVLELDVAQPGAQVSIDGDLLGTGPLARTVLLMPGAHVLVVTLPGHRPLTRTLDARAGATLRVPVELSPERVEVRVEPVVLRRSLPTWAPWVSAGAGAALVGLGALVNWSAARDFAAFDASVRDEAGAPPRAVSGDASQLDRAELQRRVAIGLYIAGGATVLAGVVLFVVDQPRPVARRERAVYVAPMTNGLVIGGAF
jgi:hypothetical protein